MNLLNDYVDFATRACAWPGRRHADRHRWNEDGKLDPLVEHFLCLRSTHTAEQKNTRQGELLQAQS